MDGNLSYDADEGSLKSGGQMSTTPSCVGLTLRATDDDLRLEVDSAGYTFYILLGSICCNTLTCSLWYVDSTSLYRYVAQISEMAR